MAFPTDATLNEADDSKDVREGAELNKPDKEVCSKCGSRNTYEHDKKNHVSECHDCGIEYETVETSIGDLFTLEEFIEMCENNNLIDYDGFGEYSDGKMITNIRVCPSDITDKNIKREWSHVCWYNK
jgi:hypothetical protein